MLISVATVVALTMGDVKTVAVGPHSRLDALYDRR
jgi:hypothetical protein